MNQKKVTSKNASPRRIQTTLTNDLEQGKKLEGVTFCFTGKLDTMT